MQDTPTAEQVIARNLASADHALNHAGRALGSTLDNVAPVLQQAAERLNDIAHQGLDAMRNGTGELGEQARRAGDRTASYIRHDPIKSVLIAAAVGAGAMALYSLLRHSDGTSHR